MSVPVADAAGAPRFGTDPSGNTDQGKRMRRFCIRSRFLAPLAVGLLALLLAGCGSNLPSVTGKVVYEDGTLVKGGSVTFNSKDKGVNASSDIADDGTFVLTFNGDKGAPPGQYKVVVVGKDTGYGAPPAVDDVFGDPLETPLTQEIVAGKNDLTISVKRPGANRPRK